MVVICVLSLKLTFYNTFSQVGSKMNNNNNNESKLFYVASVQFKKMFKLLAKSKSSGHSTQKNTLLKEVSYFFFNLEAPKFKINTGLSRLKIQQKQL